jgi:uncharacterized protein YndB with AHSA1/START domain
MRSRIDLREPVALSLRASTDIRAPVALVFAVIAAPERLPEWNGSIERARRANPDEPVGLGARAIFSGRLLGQTLESETEVIAYSPPTEFATRAIRGPRITTRFTLQSQAFGTTVTIDASGDVPGGMLGARLAEGFLRTEFTASLQHLKQIAEREALQRASEEPLTGGDPACWLDLERPRDR